MDTIVKRKGRKESFDERKIYASVYASCMGLRMKDAEAELIAGSVTKEVKEALHGADEVSSNIIHKHVAKSLARYSEDAAYMYDTHRDIF